MTATTWVMCMGRRCTVVEGDVGLLMPDKVT